MKKGMKVKLVKEPDNEYDQEAIQVKIKGLGKVGYVANSSYTVKGKSMSAGRLYDKIGKKAKAKIVFIRELERTYESLVRERDLTPYCGIIISWLENKLKIS